MAFVRNAADSNMSASRDANDTAVSCLQLLHSLRPFTHTFDTFRLYSYQSCTQMDMSMFRVRGSVSSRHDSPSTIPQRPRSRREVEVEKRSLQRTCSVPFCPASADERGCLPEMETLMRSTTGLSGTHCGTSVEALDR